MLFRSQLLHTLTGHSSYVYSVAFSPDGKTLASASADQTIKLWNLEGQLLHTLTGHSQLVYSVAFSPDGKTLASASADDTIKLWTILDLNELLVKGCDWIGDYLHNNINMKGTEDSHLCDDVVSSR